MPPKHYPRAWENTSHSRVGGVGWKGRPKSPPPAAPCSLGGLEGAVPAAGAGAGSPAHPDSRALPSAAARPTPRRPGRQDPPLRLGSRGRAARGGGAGGRRCLRLGGLGAGRRPGNMAAEAAVPALPNSGGGGAGAPSGTVPVLFCFSVFARPSSVPHGAGYELLIQKFLSLYGDQLDMHRKFVVQLFAEEWGQYVDLPKGFAVSERCKVRLVPLQIQVGPAAAAPGPARPVPAALLRCPAPRGSPTPRPRRLGRAGRPRQRRGRPRECAGAEVTVPAARVRRGRGPPGCWRRARSPPRVWSAAAAAAGCAGSESQPPAEPTAGRRWPRFYWGLRGMQKRRGVVETVGLRVCSRSCVHHLRKRKTLGVRPSPSSFPGS